MTETIQMKIKGMTCAHCEQTVEKALAAAGATDASADFRRGEATFRWPEGENIQVAERALATAGYKSKGFEILKPSPSQQRGSASGASEWDLAILGSGSAAFAAAIRGRDAGAKVVMVEQGTLGGTCVNVGCVPSKALLAAADLYYKAGHSPFAGTRTEATGVDLRALVAQKDELVGSLRQSKYADLIDEYGWTLLQGQASFADPDTLVVDGKPLRAAAYVVATGASPVVPPIPGLSNAGYLTNTTALNLAEVPESMIIVGGGPEGMEFGQLFQRLGARVTVLQRADRVLPREEADLSHALQEILGDEGMDIRVRAVPTRVEGRSGDRVVVHADVDGRGERFEATHLLLAAGRRPNTQHLALDRAGITMDDRGAVVVDQTLQTDNPRVWAAGDVTNSPQYVYVAAYQGAMVADNSLNGNSRTVDLSALPRVTFTAPQIASVGMTEQEAERAGLAVKTSVLPLNAVPRALVNQDTRGLFKLVADEVTDELLGVHILAENAGDVIYSGVLAIKYNLTVADLTGTFDPYLTMAEGLKLAAQTFGKDVSKLSCCAA
jgi:mercuric reductase